MPTLRLLGVLLDALATLAMYLLSSKLFDRTFAIFATALFALSPMLFVFTLEVRSYMLVTAVLILLLNIHWQVAVTGKTAMPLYLAYAILAATLFYIHYISVPLLAALLLHWLLSKTREPNRLTRIALTFGLTLMLVLPGLARFWQQAVQNQQMHLQLTQSYTSPAALTFAEHEEHPTTLHILAGLSAPTATVSGIFPAHSHVLLALCALPILILLVTSLILALTGDEAAKLGWLLLVLLLSAAVVQKMHAVRYLIPLAPAFILLITRALQRFTRNPRYRPAALALGSLTLALYLAAFIRQAYAPHGTPWQNTVRTIQTGYQPGDIIIFDALYTQIPFDFYARQHHFRPSEDGFPVAIERWWADQPFKGWGGPPIMQADLDRTVAHLTQQPASHTVWLVSYETNYYDPHHDLLHALQQHGTAAELPLPRDPEEPDPSAAAALHLYRIAVPTSTR